MRGPQYGKSPCSSTTLRYPAIAARIVCLAAERGDRTAQIRLARLYLEGKALPKDQADKVIKDLEALGFEMPGLRKETATA